MWKPVLFVFISWIVVYNKLELLGFAILLMLFHSQLLILNALQLILNSAALFDPLSVSSLLLFIGADSLRMY